MFNLDELRNRIIEKRNEYTEKINVLDNFDTWLVARTIKLQSIFPDLESSFLKLGLKITSSKIQGYNFERLVNDSDSLSLELRATVCGKRKGFVKDPYYKPARAKQVRDSARKIEADFLAATGIRCNVNEYSLVSDDGQFPNVIISVSIK